MYPNQFDSQTTLFQIIVLILSAYALYLFLLPKPIPGIPYNKDAANSLMGDIPALLDSQKQDISLWKWVSSQCEKLQSPIIQLWLAPFSRPLVVLSDFREAEDITMRRTKDLDRSDSLEHIFGPLFPQFHMLIKSQDPLYKRQRRWLQDLMTPGFLHNVAAEPIYQNVLKVVELWDHKARLARGRPFAAFEDIYYGALDAVFSFSFGGAFAHSAIPARLEAVASMGGVEEPSEPGGPVLFPEEARNKIVDAILTLAESVEEARKAVFPRFRSWCMHQTSRIKQAKRIRDDLIDREIEIAVERLESQEPVSSAVDHMMHREKLFAEKEGRKPVFKSVGMHSEVFGFLMAGHETSATTFGWGLKYLTDHQDIQRQLHGELRKHLSKAAAEKRQPTCEEIIKTTIPYLDATMEEILRCAGTTSVTDRQALCDTTILGHRIPKDTNVILVTIGESIMKPDFDIPDSQRTKTALNATSRIRSWNSSPYPVADFQPARWLVPSKDDADREVFDATAGPQMAFGLGPRACFGRRLAYLELRMFTVLLFWHFELLRCPDELSGYNGCVGLTVKPMQCYVRLRKIPW
ncbi:Cytochrome P450 monooxygenase TRI13 [Colletotrichum siamense]|uniref:Cytochrome P450 monooxygenase TRI13 n=1 Tax=Colletotrichum siamense TaxID=690259 RepID=A0A9P5EY54_COLSI|nr:Cytochrome P450 monooxygenase TRI13 [Colletotrichum siamense]KAF4862772.1 Cytochrome P450 monooxygenase TRI13 [Colletotrichum siamense]